MPPLADECLFLDINKLKRDGMLSSGFAYPLRWRRNGEETGTAGLVCDSTTRIRLLYQLEGPYVEEIGLDGRELAEIKARKRSTERLSEFVRCGSKSHGLTRRRERGYSRAVSDLEGGPVK